jgi:hypothetical protein
VNAALLLPAGDLENLMASSLGMLAPQGEASTGIPTRACHVRSNFVEK